MDGSVPGCANKNIDDLHIHSQTSIQPFPRFLSPATKSLWSLWIRYAYLPWNSFLELRLHGGPKLENLMVAKAVYCATTVNPQVSPLLTDVTFEPRATRCFPRIHESSKETFEGRRDETLWTRNFKSEFFSPIGQMREIEEVYDTVLRAAYAHIPAFKRTRDHRRHQDLLWEMLFFIFITAAYSYDIATVCGYMTFQMIITTKSQTSFVIFFI